MGKRGRKPSSQDDYKSPQAMKKRQMQGNLNQFFNVPKAVNNSIESIKQQSSNSKSKSKSIPNKPQIKVQHNPKQLKQTKQTKQLKQRINFEYSTLTAQQQQNLARKYLDPKITYICLHCNKDITNETKIFLKNKIYCIACGVNYHIQDEYTLIRALDDECIEQFLRERMLENVDAYNWTLKDQLMLIEGMEKYGVDSWQLIQKHMKSHHSIDIIKSHQAYFFDKFGPKISGKTLAEMNKDKNPLIQKLTKELNSFEDLQSKHITKRALIKENDGKDKEEGQKDPMKEKYLRVLRYNEKRDEFQQNVTGLYELLLSEVDDTLLENDSQELVSFLANGYENEKQIRASEEKLLKETSIMKNSTFLIENRKGEIEEIKGEAEQNNSIKQLQKQKWEDIELYLKKQYMAFHQQDIEKTKIVIKRMKLLSRLCQIDQQAEKQILIYWQNYRNSTKIQSEAQLQLEEFANRLPEHLKQDIYKLQEVQIIQAQLAQLSQKG